MTDGSPVDQLSIRVHESVSAMGRDSWDRLLAASDAPVFYDYDFLSSIEQAPLTEGAKPFLLSVHDGGRLVAALPLYFQESRDPFSTVPDPPPLRVLAGHLWHCYDTILPSAAPLTAELVSRLWQALTHLAGELDAEMYGLVNVPLRGRLAACLDELGLDPEETVPRFRLRTDGPVRDLDAHLVGISVASRRTLRRYLHRADRAGVAITRAEGRHVLEADVLGLCLATADKHAPGYYPPEPLAALIERLGPQCEIIRVTLGRQLLAASICLYDRSRMHAWAGGCRYPADLNWSPQYVLFAAELEAGFAAGRRVLECGRRNDAFKLRYGLQPYPLGRLMVRQETS